MTTSNNMKEQIKNEILKSIDALPDPNEWFWAYRVDNNKLEVDHLIDNIIKIVEKNK